MAAVARLTQTDTRLIRHGYRLAQRSHEWLLVQACDKVLAQLPLIDGLRRLGRRSVLDNHPAFERTVGESPIAPVIDSEPLLLGVLFQLEQNLVQLIMIGEV